MAVEMGAKCAFLPPRASHPDLAQIQPPTAGDSRRLHLDISGLPPFVALPHSPLGAVPIDDCAGQVIDYVFIGSCANSRIEDIEIVADILDGKHVHQRVHCVVTPGSLQIFLEALKRGLVESIVSAGAIVVPPGCGACVGTQGSIPAANDRVLSTMNRNFKGRMGSPQAQIWLASPRVAAHTALVGRIPREIDLQ
jgi:3-isopropylmalate/(R)-2-methylmalate dehydratase large subunit